MSYPQRVVPSPKSGFDKNEAGPPIFFWLICSHIYIQSSHPYKFIQFEKRVKSSLYHHNNIISFGLLNAPW